jgi:serine/threonine protein kinase
LCCLRYFTRNLRLQFSEQEVKKMQTVRSLNNDGSVFEAECGAIVKSYVESSDSEHVFYNESDMLSMGLGLQLLGLSVASPRRIAMSKANGDSLYDYIHGKLPLRQYTFEDAVTIACSLISRVLDIHSREIVHGDLKSSNCVVDPVLHSVTIIDFQSSYREYDATRHMTGTDGWMAPEIVDRKRSNSAASDVFSIGVILFELFYRAYPRTSVRLDSIPVQIQHIIGDCMHQVPSKRPLTRMIKKRIEDILKSGLGVYSKQPIHMIM